MPGTHLAPGRGRFLWEVTRYIVAWIAIVGALVGVFWLISNLLPTWLGSDDSTTTTTVVPVETVAGPTTTAPEVTTTTSTPDSTVTTVAPTTTTVPAVLNPNDLWVLVLNSTGRAGLAGTATGLLDDAGYLVLTPDNYATSLTTTRIVHAEGLGIEAAELANAFFPDAEVLLDTEGLTAADPDLVVILGTDYEP